MNTGEKGNNVYSSSGGRPTVPTEGHRPTRSKRAHLPPDAAFAVGAW